ncbi:hypothetical protein QFC22_004526 [Naganishia vaughanmartiniae]|uniref:Uncharacterized protein n=1 Tax=Naganishia vaughanmartiniae TaxID=1424756 RepID=A0ACC2X0C0_9TREE|nr:hypothetical protein QFC22_004526 [Naganishia vaughanmartiniae]
MKAVFGIKPAVNSSSNWSARSGTVNLRVDIAKLIMSYTMSLLSKRSKKIGSDGREGEPLDLPYLVIPLCPGVGAVDQVKDKLNDEEMQRVVAGDMDWSVSERILSLLPNSIYGINSFWKAEETLNHYLPELSWLCPCLYLIAVTEREAGRAVDYNLLEWIGDKLLELGGSVFATLCILLGIGPALARTIKRKHAQAFVLHSQSITTNAALQSGNEQRSFPLYIRHDELHSSQILPVDKSPGLKHAALSTEPIRMKGKVSIGPST